MLLRANHGLGCSTCKRYGAAGWRGFDVDRANVAHPRREFSHPIKGGPTSFEVP
jgi:hypothetical protein